MSKDFIVRTKEVEIVSLKKETEFSPNGKDKFVETKTEFFKDLMPGDIIEFSFVIKSTGSYKPELTIRAWRDDKFLGMRTDTWNMITGGLWCFNLREID